MSKKITLKAILKEATSIIIAGVIAGVLEGLAKRELPSNIVHISEGEAIVNGQRVHITDEAPKTTRNFGGWWTEEEDGVARDTELSDEDVADLTGREVNAVHSYRLHHRYILPSRPRKVVEVERAMNRWTPAETEYTIEEFEGKGVEWAEIGAAIGRTPGACRTQYRRATGKPAKRLA